MMALLSMCPEVYSKITRLSDIENRNSEVNAGQGFVSWFKTTADTYEIDFDRERNDYAYLYVYTPRIYKTARTDRGKTKRENEPNREEKRSRLQQYKDNGSLLKAYNYIFTGLNDQILNLDIQYDNGIALITSPNDGNLGEYSITEGVLASPNVPERISPKDTGAEAIVDEVRREDAQQSLLGLVDRLQLASGAVRDQFANQLADFTGRSISEIADVLNDATGGAAESLLNELDAASVRQLAADTNVLPQNTSPTESTVVTGGPGGDYEPDFSGFVYSEDFVNFNAPAAVDQNIDPQILVERGFIVSNQTGEPVDTIQVVENAQDMPSETDEAGASLASTRTKLFGMLTSQTINDAFLMRVEMELRGDPWYMGAPNLDGRSSEERGNFRGDDNLFWLRLAAPTVYDPDWSDEDSEINSGYWNANGTSYTFTGVYRMIKVTNTFSQGQYKVQMVANRLIDLEPDDESVPNAITTNEQGEAGEP
jgi:hypothetical protein